jgi:hypothetical protein
MSKEAGMGPEKGWAHGGEPFKRPLAPETEAQKSPTHWPGYSEAVKPQFVPDCQIGVNTSTVTTCKLRCHSSIELRLNVAVHSAQHVLHLVAGFAQLFPDLLHGAVVAVVQVHGIGCLGIALL